MKILTFSVKNITTLTSLFVLVNSVTFPAQSTEDLNGGSRCTNRFGSCSMGLRQLTETVQSLDDLFPEVTQSYDEIYPEAGIENSPNVIGEKDFSAVEKKYIELGGPPLALAQLKCFIEKHGKKTFYPKQVSQKRDPAAYENLRNRCNRKNSLAVDNQDIFAIVDYTAPSSRPRFFIFDMKKQRVRSIFVAHGRINETSRRNRTPQISALFDARKNSIEEAHYFSNTPGKNGSAGGFYLSTQKYYGKYGKSLVLHGLEKGINDNSCERTTVIHQSGKVTENGVDIMSSGCFMVSDKEIDAVVDTLSNGTLLYSFTPQEAKSKPDVCGRNVMTSQEPHTKQLSIPLAGN